MYSDIGRLTADPVLNSDGNTPRCSFSVAVNTSAMKDGNPVTIFPSITVWGKSAENCSKYLHKGDQVYFEGDLTLSEVAGRDGKNHTYVNVRAYKTKFIFTKRNDSKTEDEDDDEDDIFN